MKPNTVADISVGVIVRNEASRLRRCLEAIVGQKDLEGRLEILVIDNSSTDSTVREAFDLKREWKGFADIRIIRLESNHLGWARDRAIREARYDLIAFTDADCVAPSTWLSTMKRRFDSLRLQHPDLAGVGTGNTPPRDESVFHDALRLMFTTFIGHLNSPQAKAYSTERIVSHLPTCSVLYDRRSILNVGGFSNEFERVCEDVDLSYRLLSAGHKLMMLSGSEVVHHHSPSKLDWARKIFRYGWGQAFVARRWTAHLTPRLLLPPAFIGVFVAAFAMGPKWLIALTLGYLLVIFSFATFVCARAKRGVLVPHLMLLYAITHFSYGTGMLVGPILLVRSVVAPSVDLIKVRSSRGPFA